MGSSKKKKKINQFYAVLQYLVNYEFTLHFYLILACSSHNYYTPNATALIHASPVFDPIYELAHCWPECLFHSGPLSVTGMHAGLCERTRVVKPVKLKVKYKRGGKRIEFVILHGQALSPRNHWHQSTP